MRPRGPQVSVGCCLTWCSADLYLAVTVHARPQKNDIVQFRKDIIAPEGLEVEYTLAAGQLSEMLGIDSVFQPARNGLFVGSARLDEDTVSMTGVLDAALYVPCARCVAHVLLEKPLRISLTFIPESALARLGDGDDDTTQVDPHEAHLYRDDIIDLGQALKDELILSLPVRVLCNESCRGLCANCGINRNEASCSCEERTIDPRLMALADIRLGAANQTKGK